MPYAAFFDMHPALASFAHDPGVQQMAMRHAALSRPVSVRLEGGVFRLGAEAEDASSPASVQRQEEVAFVEHTLRSILANMDSRHFGCWMSEGSPVHWHRLPDVGYDVKTYSSILAGEVSAASDRTPGFEALQAYVDAVKEIGAMVERRAADVAARMVEICVQRSTPPAFADRVPEWKASDRAHVMAWMYAPERIGQPGYDQAVLYRMQAQSVYGAIPHVLQNASLTALIDSGARINATLADRLGTTRAGLAEIRRISAEGGFATRLAASLDTTAVIAQLALFGMPVDTWQPHLELCEREATISVQEEGGRRDRTLSTSASRIYPHYGSFDMPVHSSYGTVRMETADAVRAFKRDILKPLMNLQTSARSSPGNGLSALLDGSASSFDEPDAEKRAGRALVRAMHKAIVGDRTPEGFAKAADEVHRFSSSVAALRLEITGDADPWPALFPAWRSQNGRYEVVALASAGALVAEGLAHEHCVGDYAPECRTGRVHICSVRVDGKPAGTLELFLDMTEESARLRVGQFKGHLNQRPDDEAFEAFRQFRGDLKQKLVPLNLREVRVHAKLQETERERQWGYQLTMDDADSLWPVYRNFLLSGLSPDATVMQWAGDSGLLQAMDDYHKACTSPESENRRDEENRKAVQATGVLLLESLPPRLNAALGLGEENPDEPAAGFAA